MKGGRLVITDEEYRTAGTNVREYLGKDMKGFFYWICDDNYVYTADQNGRFVGFLCILDVWESAFGRLREEVQ